MVYGSAELLYRSYSAYFSEHRDLINRKAIVDSNLRDVDNQLKNQSNSTFACDICDIFIGLFTNSRANSNYSDAQGKIVFLKQNLESIDEKIKQVVEKMHGLQEVLNSEQAEQLFIDACGGLEKYQSLKEVTIDNQIRYQGWVLIKVEDMIEPIMRFKDVYGRKGIAVCVKSKVYGKYQVQTFFQREANTANWISYGFIIPVGGYLIDSGVLNVPAFESLKKLINNEIETWELATLKRQAS